MLKHTINTSLHIVLIPYKPLPITSTLALVLIGAGEGIRVNSCSAVIVANSSDIRKSESIGTFVRKLPAKIANGDPAHTLTFLCSQHYTALPKSVVSHLHIVSP